MSSSRSAPVKKGNKVLLGIINNALTLVRISPFWQLAAQGALILLAVVVDSVILRRLQKTASARQVT